MKVRRALLLPAAGIAVAIAAAPAAAVVDVTVTIESLAPQNGTFQTLFWVGFHDGTFDTYDLGAPASMALERLAEDGNAVPLVNDFTASGAGSMQGTIQSDMGDPPFAPGQTGSVTFTLDETDPASRWFSYASMLIPSNDAFVANGNPLAHEIFDAGGNFVGADFIITGMEVNDAGTEVNDEVPANTAFFGQMMADTGMDENGVVGQHMGFMPAGSGGILDDPMFANADFTVDGYRIARITVTPEPGTLAMLALTGVVAVARRPRRR